MIELDRMEFCSSPTTVAVDEYVVDAILYDFEPGYKTKKRKYSENAELTSRWACTDSPWSKKGQQVNDDLKDLALCVAPVMMDDNVDFYGGDGFILDEPIALPPREELCHGSQLLQEKRNKRCQELAMSHKISCTMAPEEHISPWIAPNEACKVVLMWDPLVQKLNVRFFDEAFVQIFCDGRTRQEIGAALDLCQFFGPATAHAEVSNLKEAMRVGARHDCALTLYSLEYRFVRCIHLQLNCTTNPDAQASRNNNREFIGICTFRDVSAVGHSAQFGVPLVSPRISFSAKEATHEILSSGQNAHQAYSL